MIQFIELKDNQGEPYIFPLGSTQGIRKRTGMNPAMFYINPPEDAYELNQENSYEDIRQRMIKAGILLPLEEVGGNT